MEPRTDLFDLLDRYSPVTHAATIYGVFLQILFAFVFFLFLLFAVIIVRQVRLMGETMTTPLAPVLRVISWSFLLVTMFVLAMAVLTL